MGIYNLSRMVWTRFLLEKPQRLYTVNNEVLEQAYIDIYVLTIWGCRKSSESIILSVAKDLMKRVIKIITFD